jgi:hypothetical protein
MHRCLRHCQASVIALVACCQAGIVALVVMALLLLMHRHLCRCCDCDCSPYDSGIFAIVNMTVSLPLSSWRCCPHNNGAIALDP